MLARPAIKSRFDVAAFKAEFPQQLIDALVIDHLADRLGGWGALLWLRKMGWANFGCKAIAIRQTGRMTRCKAANAVVPVVSRCSRS